VETPASGDDAMRSRGTKGLMAVLLVLVAGCGSCGSDSGPEEGYVHANGVDLCYRVVGRGEPIIVLHGGPGADHHHMSQLETLSDQ